MSFTRPETLKWLLGRVGSRRDQLHHSAILGSSYKQLGVGRSPTSLTVGLFLTLRNLAHGKTLGGRARHCLRYGPIRRPLACTVPISWQIENDCRRIAVYKNNKFKK